VRAWSTAVLLAAAAVAGPAAVDVGAAQPPSVSAISVYQAHSCAQGGIFTLQQKLLHAGKKAGLTILKLAGPLPSGCTGSGAAASSKHRHGTTRRLWGDAKGNYRYGAATVGGTKWLTQDTCAGTLVRVARGIVSVNDFAQKRTVPVKAPDSYLAHR